MLRLLQRLQEGSNTTGSHVGQWLLANFELTLVAMANPDGRHRLEATENYCWRGTSTGVDLNRNFDFDFGGQGSSANPKDEEFRGPFAGSEPETQALVQLAQESVYDVFLSLHSGARQVYIPFSDARSISTGRSPPFAKHMERVAAAAVAKHNGQSGEPFAAGPAQQLLEYPASGTAFDYMAGTRRIPLAYALELYGDGVEKEGGCFQLFNPPSSQLTHAVDTAETMLASVTASFPRLPRPFFFCNYALNRCCRFPCRCCFGGGSGCLAQDRAGLVDA
jgi:hypothetical protein